MDEQASYADLLAAHRVINKMIRQAKAGTTRHSMFLVTAQAVANDLKAHPDYTEGDLG